MKNIHVLPTDKPSRLWFHKLNRNLGFSDLPMEYNGSGTWVEGRNIDITSDEEIKEGDWCLYLGLSMTRFKVIDIDDYKLYLGSREYFNKNLCKKIILTDNKDLIKDGVQAINDDFLEWFVKNPSCEFVEIYRSGNHYDGAMEFYHPLFYKTIIPKEEPKKETLEESNQTTAIRFLEWYRRRGIIYQFHSYHIPMDDRKYLNALQLFEIFKKELYE
jgi:hypothetical protein